MCFNIVQKSYVIALILYRKAIIELILEKKDLPKNIEQGNFGKK